MKKTASIVLVVVLIAGIVAISGCTSSNNSTTKTAPFNVTKNFTVNSSGYGTYNINGQITPTKDFNYIEMVAVWYDSSGAVIYQNPLAWNANDLKANQAYNINAMSSLYNKGTPARLELFFFDSPFSGSDTSSNIFAINITLS